MPTAAAGAVLVAAFLACLLGAAPAWAHTELESATPADGSRVADAPREVALTFSEQIPADGATITVRGPDGAGYAAGPAAGAGTTLTVPLRPLGPAGTYTVEYRVVSEDGRPVTGTVAFDLTAPGPAAAAPAAPATPGGPDTSAAATPDDDGGTPVWPWIVGAVIVLGGGAAVALRRAAR